MYVHDSVNLSVTQSKDFGLHVILVLFSEDIM